MVKICTGCGRLDTQPLGLNKKGEPYLACCPDNNYKYITALDWFFSQLPEKTQANNEKEYHVAKAMEKEQIMKAARQCHFEGVRQSAKTSEGYIFYAEQYYNQTYNNGTF